MIVIGLILSVFGVGFLCWLLFTLAVYALPLFAGMTAGLAAYHSGRRPRRTCCGVRCGRGCARRGPSRLCSRQIAGPTRRDRHRFRGAGRHCRLPRNAGPCPHRRAFGELAGSLCNRRRDCRRRNRVRSFGGEGRPARCRTRWGAGARPVAGDGRDQTRVKQPVRRVGLESGSASSAGPGDREGGALKRAGHFSPSAQRQSKRNGGDYRRAVFWSGARPRFSTPRTLSLRPNSARPCF